MHFLPAIILLLLNAITLTPPSLSATNIDPLLAINDDALLLDDNNLLDDDDFLLSDIEDTAPQTPGPYDKNKGFKITLGALGTLVFAPSPEAVAQGTAAPLEKTTSNTIIFPVKLGRNGPSITKPKLNVTNNGNLSFTGIFNANNQKGKLSLKTFKDNEMSFTISFKKPFEVQITPDKKTTIQSFTLDISNDSTSFYANKSVFTKDDDETKITFGLGDDDAARAVTDEIPLHELMPEAKESKNTESIMLEDLSFKIANPFSEQMAPTNIIVECTAKLDHITLWESTKAPNTTCTITMSRMGTELTTEGETPIVFDPAFTLNKTLIEVRANKGEKPEIELSGTLDCNFPVLGKMNFPVKGEKRDDGIELRGKIQNKIGFNGLSFGNPEILLYTSDGTGVPNDPNDPNATPMTAPTPPIETNIKQEKVEISGTANFLGLDIIPVIRFVKPPNGGARLMEFDGRFKAKNLNPFALIPELKDIPGLSDFKIPDASLGMDTAKKFFIGGATKVFGFTANIKLKPSIKMIDISSMDKWRLSDTFPDAKGTPLDDLVFDSVRFACAASDSFDYAANMPITKGTNIFGTIDTAHGAFANLRKIMGGALPKKVTVSVVMAPNPRHCKVVVQLPMDVKISDKAMLCGLSFEISGEPSYALMLTLRFTPTKSDPPLLFTARIEFELIGLALSGTMAGFWHHPFGITGLHVGDLATECKFSYTFTPIAFGIAGTVEIGSFLVKVAVKMGADDIILLGEMSKLPLFVFPEFLRQVGIDLGPLNIIKAFDVNLEDVKFKFAPTGGQIGMLYFDPGISGQGKLNINIPGIINTYAEAAFNVSIPQGFKLYARMPSFNLGPLKITGKGPDGKYGTDDDGIVLRIVLGLLEQRAFMSGKTECFGTTSEIEVDLRLLSARIKMMLNILNLVDAKVIGETYRKGLRIGFRVLSQVKLGKSTLKMLGDLNTYGYMMSGRLDSLTIKDLASIIKLPEEIIPDIGFKDVEAYVKYMPLEHVANAVSNATHRAKEAIQNKIDETLDPLRGVAQTVNDAATKTSKAFEDAGVAIARHANEVDRELTRQAENDRLAAQKRQGVAIAESATPATA